MGNVPDKMQPQNNRYTPFPAAILAGFRIMWYDMVTEVSIIPKKIVFYVIFFRLRVLIYRTFRQCAPILRKGGGKIGYLCRDV